MSSLDEPRAKTAKPVFYDAHNHLQDEWLAPYRRQVMQQLDALPITGAVVNGTGESDWSAVSQLAAEHAWVVPSFGVHPWFVGRRSTDWQTTLEQFLEQHPGAGVGEIGLDRWILDRARPDDLRLAGLTRAPLAEQEIVFAKQLQIAAERNLATTIHCLEAWGPLWAVLQKSDVPACGFLLHAYGGPKEMISGFLERGAYFSFNGSFLDPRKQRQREVFEAIPVERLLVETDAPAMPLPPEWRTHKLPRHPAGPLNHPANIEAVYTGLAALRGLPIAELSDTIAANFRRLFGSV